MAGRKNRQGKQLEQTPYEKYGGFSTVSRIVMTLYEKLLEDDDVGPFFDDVDMPKLIDHQTKFVSSLMGGPASFSDTHIASAHRHLTINDVHFDRLKALIDETLEEFSIESDDAQIVLDAFEARRDLLVEP
jgi:hemoglobin